MEKREEEWKKTYHIKLWDESFSVGRRAELISLFFYTTPHTPNRKKYIIKFEMSKKLDEGSEKFLQM